MGETSGDEPGVPSKEPSTSVNGVSQTKLFDIIVWVRTTMDLTARPVSCTDR